MRATPLTIVLPARDEERNLARCLDALRAQDHVGRVRVVVVANGCRDRTAEVARGFVDRLPIGYELRVLELPAASKPEALNAGDRMAMPGHRVYLDADAVLSANVLRSISCVLDAGCGIHLCAPRRLIRRPNSRLASCYARVWSALPYIEDSIVFCGVYAVSEAGRLRWGAFPPIHSEDKFVRLHFEAGERYRIPDAVSTVSLPERASSLLRSRVRWCRETVTSGDAFPSSGSVMPAATVGSWGSSCSGPTCGPTFRCTPPCTSRPPSWPAWRRAWASTNGAADRALDP